MKTFACLLLTGLVSLAAADSPGPATYVPPKFEKPPASIPGSTRYVYKTAGGFDLPIYVFSPPSAASTRPAPAVVFFHGSGWHSGTVTQFIEHARRLAQLGLVTALAEYRIKVDYGATPFDGVADAKSAVRWLRAHASGLKLDPHRVAVAGGSAGAHLALCTGVFDGRFDNPTDDLAVSARPDLIFLFAAVTDTTQGESEAEPNPLFRGREREISPIHHLKRGLPPTQIFHGVNDPWATIGRVRTFAAAVEANGDECDLIAFEGRSHFFYNHPAYYTRYPAFTPVRGQNDFDLCLLLMTRFLRAHGFLATRPTVPAADTTRPAVP
jgi:acetyl esterase/lipase